MANAHLAWDTGLHCPPGLEPKADPTIKTAALLCGRIAPPLATLGAGSGLDPEAAKPPKDETSRRTAPAVAGAIAPPGLAAEGRAQKKPTAIHRGHCPSWARAAGGLLGPTRTLLIQRRRHNQPNSSNFANLYASSCHPMLEFAGFHAGLCRTSLAQMLEFAGPYSPLRLG
jgi:hypothetical protein